jgi:hypothetical protein
MVAENEKHSPGLAPDDRTHLALGLAILFQAQAYVKELNRDGWVFTVELRALREAGLDDSDLFWLVCKGYLRHVAETAYPELQDRRFMELLNLALPENTCFLLTEAGIRFLRHFCSEPVPRACPSEQGEPGWRGAGAVTPYWDSERRELKVGDVVVKQFRQPAWAQEIVLSAFQEEQWPWRIDDPLPPQLEQDPKRHLNITITNLNRRQKNRLIRFCGDGTGSGVIWEPLRGGQNGTAKHSQGTAERK